MSYPSGNWARPQILASKLIFFVAYANFGILAWQSVCEHDALPSAQARQRARERG